MNQALGDYILVRPHPVKTISDSGIIIPANAQKPTFTGDIISVPRGCDLSGNALYTSALMEIDGLLAVNEEHIVFTYE